ncbi:exopolysaccharide transport family protein [Allorhizobium taibaishanense]|uniref:Chain-length determining protein n=1 Tax=Allorhizobium taibaishanense TaxID=887144 RepID=A0A1Q8ZYY3_9HYPH|nr:Wzz/FepE/Etk N-terminal domain-containing protein [Allorhizobium taibaishanense]MBB4007560.1 exopolysaccharide transport family protein [Allorhizobium taibaishanense]OLP47501.1 chain-length determining protein [Allorhizobium taibaishanense]
MSGQPVTAHQDVDIDLLQLFRAVWQRKGRILAIACLAAGVAFVGSSLIRPTYRAETTVLIEPRAPNYDAENAKSAASEPVLDELNIASQVQLFRSADLIRQVVKDLKLYELPEFDPDLHPSAMSDLMVMLHLKKNPLDLAPEDRVIRTFLDKLQVYQVEKSRVIGIEFSSKDAKLTAAIPNEMVKVYLAVQSGAKLDSNEDAARWLEPEIANLRQKVAEAEKKVADYRRGADLLSTGEGGTFASKQLNDISTELARVRADRANAEARAENARTALKAGRPTDNIDVVMASPAVQQLKQAEAAVQAQISDLSTSLLDGHPRIKALKAQLANLRQQLTDETRKVVSSLENDATVARMREAQLDKQLTTAKAESAKAGDSQVGLAALEREASAQRQLLETYLARYREATSRLDSNATPADARVISRASEPSEPNFPKVLPITVVAGIAALVLSMIVVMLAELFSGRALRPVGPVDPNRDTGRDPRRDTGRDGYAEPPLPRSRTATPESDRRVATETAAAAAASRAAVLETAAFMQGHAASSRNHRIPADDAIEAAAVESFEATSAEADHVQEQSGEEHLGEEHGADHEFSIASVARYLTRHGVSKALVISPSGDDGSAATVLLARAVAKAGRTVILIDMTGSGHPTALMAERPDLPGVTDLLCGDVAFGETIHSDRLSGAHIVPKGNSDIRLALHGVERLSMVVEALADVYDLVLIECGPASADNVVDLCKAQEHEVILSAPDPDRDELARIMAAFEAVGYDDLVLMSDATPASPDGDDRRVA